MHTFVRNLFRWINHEGNSDNKQQQQLQRENGIQIENKIKLINATTTKTTVVVCSPMVASSSPFIYFQQIDFKIKSVLFILV